MILLVQIWSKFRSWFGPIFINIGYIWQIEALQPFLDFLFHSLYSHATIVTYTLKLHKLGILQFFSWTTEIDILD